MWLLSFYRLYVSLLSGVAGALLVVHTWWFGVIVALGVRLLWGLAEMVTGRILINRDVARHIFTFKQELGPYGIRIANKAETDASVRKSLAEVFTGNEKKLRKTVETLEMMDTLFKAGMRPDGDAYQLHDLKLKYGKWRLERLNGK
jgi:hypothetical protein